MYIEQKGMDDGSNPPLTDFLPFWLLAFASCVSAVAFAFGNRYWYFGSGSLSALSLWYLSASATDVMGIALSAVICL